MRIQSVRWRIARRHLNPPRRRIWLRWTIALVFLTVLASSGAAAAASVYFVQQLPSTSKFHIHYAFQDARIYASDGSLLYDAANLGANGGRRVVVGLQARHDPRNACHDGVNRIPVLLQNATIATEDATFYKNPGFDPLSIVRAAYQDVAYGHIVSGASTITQQVVRNTMLNPHDKTFNRKAQEVALAYEISKEYSKRKILWYYLNSVPYGNTAIGAQAAAHVYFNRPVCTLDLAEVALLAGLPRAPTLYDPVRHRDAAMKRMKQVLALMRLHGYLHTKAEIQAAIAEAHHWVFRLPRSDMRYPQFVRYVLDQMDQLPQLKGRLYQGLDVYTTIDPRLQDVAQHTVTSQIDSLAGQHVTNGALISLDVRRQHYGWILAMVGSSRYSDQAGQINMTTTPRQPGSSMKPFNYINAFTQQSAGPGTTVIDAPVVLPDPNDQENHGWYQPTNYDHLFHGQVTLREALANSLNVPAVKVEYYLTQPKNVARTAFAYGMSSLYRDNPGLDCDVCYALTLGGLAKGTRLLEETAAYGVFATGGHTVPPVAIWKVVRRSHQQVIYCSSDCSKGVPSNAPQSQALLDPAHAYEMTDVLSDNNARCTVQVCEFGLNSPLLLDRPAAAKTGTTNSFTDNWTVGYTPQIVTGVWAGNADRSPMQNVIGVTGAAPIWHDFMEAAFKILKLPVVPFVAPTGVIRTAQCQSPGNTAVSIGSVDIMVGNAVPLCSLPDRGFMPVQCNFNGSYSYSTTYPTPAPVCAQLTPYPFNYQESQSYYNGTSGPYQQPPGTTQYPPGSTQGQQVPPAQTYPQPPAPSTGQP